MTPDTRVLDGATPLDPDESEGLIPRHIATRGELNEAEEANIARGFAWGLKVLRRRDVLSESFVYDLHARMFGDVWGWAGAVRRSNKNIGIDRFRVRMAVRDLMADAAAWREGSVYVPDEAAVRLHHRLVWIHPFPNGNGRHARMMADLYMVRERRRPLPWGPLADTGALRAAYVSALRAADRDDYRPLLEFARGSARERPVRQK
ncbi:MAG: mobile mystery protein [Gemmatimonadetes bacterium]|nr:mobile mystery protein [Gemmatimonadota bacterium]